MTALYGSQDTYQDSDDASRETEGSSDARERLDQATNEPQESVEQKGDYKEAEALEDAFQDAIPERKVTPEQPPINKNDTTIAGAFSYGEDQDPDISDESEAAGTPFLDSSASRTSPEIEEAAAVTLEGSAEPGRMTIDRPSSGADTVMIDTVPLPESPAAISDPSEIESDPVDKEDLAGGEIEDNSGGVNTRGQAQEVPSNVPGQGSEPSPMMGDLNSLGNPRSESPPEEGGSSDPEAIADSFETETMEEEEEPVPALTAEQVLEGDEEPEPVPVEAEVVGLDEEERSQIFEQLPEGAEDYSRKAADNMLARPGGWDPGEHFVEQRQDIQDQFRDISDGQIDGLIAVSLQTAILELDETIAEIKEAVGGGDQQQSTVQYDPKAEDQAGEHEGGKGVLDDLRQTLDGMNELSEMTSLRLQMAMDRRSKFISTLSQLLKKISTTQDNLIQNIK